jgi:hypothetical protein
VTFQLQCRVAILVFVALAQGCEERKLSTPQAPAVTEPESEIEPTEESKAFKAYGRLLWEQVRAGTFSDAELDRYLRSWWEPQYRDGALRGLAASAQYRLSQPWSFHRVLGTFVVADGVIVHRCDFRTPSRDVLGRLNEKPRCREQWWFWTGDELYRIDQQGWRRQPFDAREKLRRRDGFVTPPPRLAVQFVEATETCRADREWRYSRRIENLLAHGQSAYAMTVVGYMLSLPEVSTDAYWLAADVAAADVGARQQLRIGRIIAAFEALERRDALDFARVGSWPYLRDALDRDSALRYAVHEIWSAPRDASDFLNSLTVAIDMARTVSCDEDDQCEDFKELHEDLVITDGQKSVLLAYEVQDWLFEPSASMVDVEGRLFIAAAGVAYEVNLKEETKRVIGPADRLVHEGEEGFPFVMVIDRGGRAWETWEHDGDFARPSGCYALPAGRQDTIDFFWRIRKTAQGFDLLDPILQRRVQLRETACNPGLRLRRGAVPDLFSHLGRKIQPRMK